MKNFEMPQLKIVAKNTDAKRWKLEQELLPKDRDLRHKLEEGEFADNRNFLELINEMIAHLRKLDSIGEGIEKARILASLYGLVRQLKKTQFSRLSEEFIRISEEIRKNSPRAVYRKQPEAKDKIG